MKVSYKWLQKFVNIDKTPEEVARELTLHSFEVENIIKEGEGLNKVVVGEVLEVRKHPDADKLKLTKVRISKDEVLDIVCGAPNVEVGQRVAVALVGAKLSCGLEIQERKVRGERSCGMICAEDEIGLGQGHEGIMVLDEKLEVGGSVQKALGLDDTIFEIDILPNRAHDCLGHYGIAREVAVLFGLEIEKYDMNKTVPSKSQNSSLSIDVQDQEACKRYSAGIIRDAKVKDSPEWIKLLLKKCDLRPINSFVDITNYIMFSFGQPMHAFDADKVGGKIVVRKAKKGEKILALDDNEYELEESDLVICDEKRPIAIAGVIGGKETAITGETKNIIFESANFEGVGIRKTARRLKIFTDSSYRFEREIDPEMTIFCLKEAMMLAKEISGGEISEDILDVYKKSEVKKEINFEFSRIENLLGLRISENDVVRILESIGFVVKIENGKVKVVPPSYRIDIEKVNDVLEEIARINGYEKVEAKSLQIDMKAVVQKASWNFDKKIRGIFEGLGFSETYNRSFVGERDIELFGFKNCIELKNYLSRDAKFFRPSLLPDFLRNVQENSKYKDSFRIFELGKVAVNLNGEAVERKNLGGVLYSKSKESNLFALGKGVAEAAFSKLGMQTRYSKMCDIDGFWHEGRSADIKIAGTLIGKIGEMHPKVLENIDVEGRIVYFEFYVDELLELYKQNRVFEKINKFPESEFDLAVVVDSKIEWQQILDLIFDLKNENIIRVKPFDVYSGENIGLGKKSIAFRVTCQARDRTLDDGEIKGIMNEIIGKLKGVGGEIRG